MNNRKINKDKMVVSSAFVVLFTFLLVNLFWLINVFFPFYGYRNGFKKESHKTNGSFYVKETEFLKYRAQRPDYLSYSRFLFITQNTQTPLDESGNAVTDIVCLFIWPVVGGKYEYGITVDESGFSYQIYVDENGSLIPSDEMTDEQNKTCERLLSENQSTVTELINSAESQWGLNGYKDITDGISIFFSNYPVLSIIFTLCLVAAVIALFLTYLWLMSYIIPFESYIEQVDTHRHNVITDEDHQNGYLYLAGRPEFLKKNGYLSIQNNSFAPNDGADYIKLKIYPFAETDRYYIYINKKGIKMDMTMDSALVNGSLSKEEKEEIEKMFNQARQLWNFEK